MRVFISHDFKDRNKFEEVSEALRLRGIEIFNPRQMHGTQRLADQLRESINSCAACVFVATNHSVNSAWCAAELGAFWGTGKQVVIYVADSSLKEEQLPKQFAGWLLVENVFKVADDLEALQTTDKELDSGSPGSLLGTLTIGEFKTLLIEQFHQSDIEEIIVQLAGDFDYDYDSERSNRWMGRGLPRLLGETLPKAKELKVRGWRYAFDAPTTTGIWIGYAQVSEKHADGMLQLYRNCLVLRVDEQRKIIGAAMTRSVSIASRALGLSSWTVGENVLAFVGTVELGLAVPEIDPFPAD
jgi:hypothetical protein